MKIMLFVGLMFLFLNNTVFSGGPSKSERVPEDYPDTRGQIVFTGDDFNFESLIRGDHDLGERAAVLEIARWVKIGDSTCALGDFSHALLGFF